jgi:hypothetical protein
LLSDEEVNATLPMCNAFHPLGRNEQRFSCGSDP